MLKLAKSVIKSLVIVLGVGVIGLKAPDVHKSWLRNKVSDNVVRITAGPHIPSGGGTGFVIKTPSGGKVTVTNRHICDGLGNQGLPLYAETTDGRYSKLNVIEISQDNDLCILNAVPGLDGLDLGGDLENGDNIYVVGHPYLWDVLMTEGEIAGVTTILLRGNENHDGECKYLNGKQSIFGCIEFFESYVSSVKTAGGNSGSPVVNGSGDVVGVLFAGTQAGYSAIVPISYLKDLVAGY